MLIRKYKICQNKFWNWDSIYKSCLKKRNIIEKLLGKLKNKLLDYKKKKMFWLVRKVSWKIWWGLLIKYQWKAWMCE